MNDTLFPCTALWRSIAEAGPGSGIGAFGDGVDEGRAAMVERLPVGIAVGPLYRPFEGGVEALRLHFDGVGVIGRVAALHGVGGHGVSSSERSREWPRRSAASSSRRVAVPMESARRETGRAPCRERVCQYWK